jgi:tetratricopeptide (TPR) repeat protein
MSPERLAQAEQAHQRGDLQSAERLYREVLAGDPGNASACYGLGTLLMQRGDLDEAEKQLRAAAVAEPGAADIAFNLALCLRRREQPAAARAEALRAAALARGDESFSAAIAELLMSLQDPQAAVDLLRASPVTRPQTALLLSRAFGAINAWDAAVSLLRQLCAQQPADAELARQLSLAAGRLRDYPLAIDAYRRSLENSAPSARDHVRFADLYLLARDVEASAAQLDLAEAAGADDGDYHLLRARVARLRGEDTAATAACELALARNPGLGQAWAMAIELAEDSALPELRSALAGELETAEMSAYDRELMTYALADAEERLGGLAEAAEALRSANRLQQTGLENMARAYDAAQEEQRLQRTRVHFAACPESSATGAGGGRRPVFVVGMPRSGTTLVERVLSRLEGVVAGGENEALGFVASQYERDLAAKTLPPPAQLNADQWQSLADRYWSLSAVKGAVVTDKMPHNYLHVGLILGMFPDARVIQMRRDPRDTVLSIYSRPFPPDHNYACDPQALAHAWQLAQAYMDHWAALDSARVMDVSFEAFVNDPEQGSQRLADFCQLPWHVGCLEPQSEQGPSFTFSERQVRRTIDSSHVGGWRRYQEFLPELFDNLPQP